MNSLQKKKQEDELEKNTDKKTMKGNMMKKLITLLLFFSVGSAGVQLFSAARYSSVQAEKDNLWLNTMGNLHAPLAYSPQRLLLFDRYYSIMHELSLEQQNYIRQLIELNSYSDNSIKNTARSHKMALLQNNIDTTSLKIQELLKTLQNCISALIDQEAEENDWKTQRIKAVQESKRSKEPSWAIKSDDRIRFITDDDTSGWIGFGPDTFESIGVGLEN